MKLRTPILITGAYGQIGSELTLALRERYGGANVIATDIRSPGGANGAAHGASLLNSGPHETIDCTNRTVLEEAVTRHRVGTIYHLAALLSATAEDHPQKAWEININGLLNVLEIAREHGSAVFVPSSIAAFGPDTPRDQTPQDTLQRPSTIYGITKVTGELLCDYYFRKFGVDARGVRYPGIISHQTLPGGGTTDYAVEIYYHAVKHRKYACFLKAGTFLDMLYMPDCIAAAIQIMEADPSRLKHRNAFNVTSMSLDPECIAVEIRKHIPDFTIHYHIDPKKQSIAESWPRSMSDSAARVEWDWAPQWNLAGMTRDMLETLGARHANGQLGI